MKKAKNEAVNSKTKTQNNNEIVNGKTIPSDNMQIDIKDEKELPFKKVLYGFNPDEVHSFITELTESYEASLKLHESKLSAMKEELAFSNRERDRYIKKCKDYQSEAQKKPTPDEDKTDEYKATISSLTEKIRMLEAENENLKNAQYNNASDSNEQYTKKIALLETRNREIESALSSAKDKNAELSEQLKKHTFVSNEYKTVVQDLEETKARLSHCENELKIKCEESEEKTAKINLLTAEKNETKKKITELEVKNSVLSQRIAESEEENSKLRETNKSLIFENAEKINELENEHAKNKLAVQKELKLYGYYIDRAELTVAELTKQIEQIKQSINNSEI